ncbi:biosynthetic peptidoglycan transglycosylase [Vibrio palustris]|uniref:Penicillin-binding protein 1A/1B n=1 Tax=Vibrio palustris TaxID=1918946 RepID=A0A1R4B523_9VIBR|nr:biosynthetic peptidoglycan transglycosylase [Vibrio palustris]SJL84015.1 Penicillin-binding protein 1A/1B [Vibrio palustris]
MKKEWRLICREMEKCRLENQKIELSDNLLWFLVIGEDHRFWSHYGCDPVGLLRAFWCSNIRKSRQGGSTIAMQLVRTIIKKYEPTLKRKLIEIILAFMLTRKYSKEQILRTYLLVAYFGWNMHGVKQACHQIGVNYSKLDDYSAASIVARLKYPQPRHYNEIKENLIQMRTNYLLERTKLTK